MDVSVIIPTRNRTDFLQRALKSVATQAIPSMEVCVVDNNKEQRLSDEVREVVEEFREAYPSIHWIYLFSEKAYASGARNDGMRKVSGRYICFLDDDDYLLPGSIGARKAVMDADPEIALLYTACYSRIYPYPFRIYRYYRYNERRHTETLLMMSCSCMFLHRERFASNDLYFDERLCRRDDYDLCRQLLARRLKVVSLPQPMMVINLHSRQRISSNPLNFYDDRAVLRAKWGEAVEPNMFEYAQGLYFWRKCFGMPVADYPTAVAKLKEDFGRMPSRAFAIKWRLMSVSPLLFLGFYHVMIAVRQVYLNRLR